MITRFERDVKRCTFRIMSASLHVAKGLNFCMRQTCASMPPAPYDFSAFHQNCTDHWIGRSRAITAAGKPKREAHELEIFFSHRLNTDETRI